MKLLIYLPLTILVVLSVFSILGVLDGNFGSMIVDSGNPAEVLYYDSGGHPVIYANGTEYGETGQIRALAQSIGFGDDDKAVWWNLTGWDAFIGATVYDLYWDTGSQYHVLYKNVGDTAPNQYGIGELSLWSTLGFLVLITGIVALALIAGLRVFSSGTSEFSVSVIVMSASYSAIWGVFSAMGLSFLNLLGLFGYILYFLLTIMYTLGIISTFGGNSGE